MRQMCKGKCLKDRGHLREEQCLCVNHFIGDEQWQHEEMEREVKDQRAEIAVEDRDYEANYDDGIWRYDSSPRSCPTRREMDQMREDWKNLRSVITNVRIEEDQ